MGLVAVWVGGLGASASALSCKQETAQAEPRDAACVLVAGDRGPVGLSSIKAEIVARGLEVPWAISFLPSGDMLVTERPGRVRVVRQNGILEAPVVRFEAQEEEGGTLGLALSPRFIDDHYFYIYRTTPDDNRVERYTLSADQRSAKLDRVILSGIARAKYHDGGRIHFGPDGKLYVSTGDARQPDLAQDPASLNGKLLRLEPDGSAPADNPSPGSLMFAYGVRNSEGFDWMRDRTLVMVDHGPSGELGRYGHDEVDVVHRGDNLGWPAIYGCERQRKMTSPVLSWQSAMPPGGAAFYTGYAISEWRGSLLIGVLGAKQLHRVVFSTDGSHRVIHHEQYFRGDPPQGFGRLRDVTMGPDHELYVTTSNCDGRGLCPPTKDAIIRITRQQAD